MLIALMGLTSMAANADVSTVTKNLKARFPATEIKNVEQSPIKGVYEITLGKSIAYTDESGEYFLFGDVIRMKDQQNMTSPKRDELKKVDFSTLPFKDAITYKKGKGERKLAVFSDPQCPYCKRLEVELMKLDNVTIYVFTNPLTSLHPEARNLSKKIWCSKDKSKAWRDYLISGIEPTSDGQCTNPVDANVKLSRDLGFDGTPMTLLVDGTVVAGAVSAGELDYKLDKAELSKKK
ncbi:DsbC family protein [Acinetobacter sp. ANC 5380]|uniref:Thiol:disulfide interchange protein n=2 Tax=Acinetobacter terrae TaxID=2731247 RepID=A0A7Y2REZ3_9GAMM|nr:DsbC family protein [Acinetobacter terrae]